MFFTTLCLSPLNSTQDCALVWMQGYRGAHTILELDRSNVLGTTCSASFVDHVDVSHPRAQTPLERMQHFLTMVHDTTYHILGNSGPSLGRDFYQLEGLVPNILTSLFANLEVSIILKYLVK